MANIWDEVSCIGHHPKGFFLPSNLLSSYFSLFLYMDKVSKGLTEKKCVLLQKEETKTFQMITTDVDELQRNLA